MSCARPFVVCVEEQGSFTYDFTLYKDDGSPVLLAELLTLSVSVVTAPSGAVGPQPIVTNRDVLNDGTYGTYHATSGAGSVRFVAADNVIVDPLKTKERHRAEFSATWAGGGSKHWPIEILVDDMLTLS